MSRMTKFLRQRCVLERVNRDLNGVPRLDKYGEPSYLPAMSLPCRREGYVRDVQTNTGSILRSSTRYFLDNTVEVLTGDKLDGKVTLAVAEYINGTGSVEGYECYA